MGRQNIFLVVLGILSACEAGIADDKSKPDPDPVKIVQKLGANTFGDREAAHKQLIAIGGKAKPAVLAGTRSTDPEIARRCEAILPLVRAAERKELVDGTGEWPPEGQRFKVLLGDTSASRKLFAEMVGDERRATMLEAVTVDSTAAGRIYASEVTRLQKAADDVMFPAHGQLGDKEQSSQQQRSDLVKAVRPCEVTLILFLGSLQASEGEAGLLEVDRVLTASFIDLSNGPLRIPTCNLFAAWLERRKSAETITNGLELAQLAGIEEALPFARRLFANPKATGTLAGTAAVVIGTLGTKDDLARLSDRRDDCRTCWGSGTDRVQVRDVVAAMSLGLRGERLEAYGFRLVKYAKDWAGTGADNPLIRVSTFFETNKDREAAHKKAWEWLDQQPGAPTPVNAKR